MFVISYSDIVELPFYSDFKIYYMNGLRVVDVDGAKAIVNVDSKTAYIYCE